MALATPAARKPTSFPPEAPAIPRLENGDILDAEEFLRRCEAHDEPRKAELIFGRVYVAPPVSGFEHGYPHSLLMTVLGTFMAASRGVLVFDNSTLRLGPKNVPQPDIFMFVDPDFGGRATLDKKRYVTSGVDLVAEIARTSTNFDLHDKLALYEQNQFPEYIVWRVLDRAIDYFILRNNKYVPHSADAAGVFHSVVYPGLRIDSRALLAGDLAAALATVQAGVASEPHAEFLKTLKPKA